MYMTFKLKNWTNFILSASYFKKEKWKSQLKKVIFLKQDLKELEFLNVVFPDVFDAKDVSAQ